MTQSQKRDLPKHDIPREKLTLGRLTRGMLARESGVNGETIRFYEKIGLMPDPPRTASGHRRYGSDHLKRLKFVRRSRELGFTNKEVVALLEMADGGNSCGSVKSLALDNITLISKKMTDLARMKTALEAMTAQCKGDEAPGCAIIERLLED
jgi:MerR family transcriptional regulator, mercuric resistance operon regulatory protein